MLYCTITEQNNIVVAAALGDTLTPSVYIGRSKDQRNSYLSVILEQLMMII